MTTIWSFVFKICSSKVVLKYLFVECESYRFFFSYCYFSNTLSIFFYLVALGPERRKSDSGVMLPTLRVSLIQDMRYLLYVLASGGNFAIVWLSLKLLKWFWLCLFLAYVFSKITFLWPCLFYFHTVIFFLTLTPKGKCNRKEF